MKVGREACVVCEEPITNPICQECLREAVRQWLMEQGQSGLMEEVDRMTMSDHDGTTCIGCGNRMRVCAYCYTKDVFHIIEKRPELVPAYLAYFNFDLEHMGWERDARAYVDD
jgi:ferredoxin